MRKKNDSGREPKRRGRPPKIEKVEPPKIQPPVEKEEEPVRLEQVSWHPNAYPHCICSKCGAGEPPIRVTKPAGLRTLRYHECWCGHKFRSMSV